MAFDVLSIPKRFYKTFSNLRTGIVLLILVVIAAAMGTFILQRPATDLSKLQAAYSPQTLQLLDRVGLTDVFHSWWFLTLLNSGQPEHRFCFCRSLSQCVAFLCAALSQDGRAFPLCQSV